MLSSWALSGSCSRRLPSADSKLIGLGLVHPGGPAGSYHKTRHRMIKQISPDKSMNCHSTTASFTVSTEPRALLSCANLPMDSAFYDVSVRRLTALLQASSPQSLAALQLPFANNYSILKSRYWGSLIGDLHPSSSCPCRAYTSGFSGCYRWCEFPALVLCGMPRFKLKV